MKKKWKEPIVITLGFLFCVLSPQGAKVEGETNVLLGDFIASIGSLAAISVTFCSQKLVQQLSPFQSMLMLVIQVFLLYSILLPAFLGT